MKTISPRRRHPLAVLLLGLLASAVLAAPALAAENGATDEDRPPISLRVSPAVLEVPLQSGSARHELRVDNQGTQPLEVMAELAEFTVTEDGTTSFLGPDELSATAWARLDAGTFELAPGERRDVVLTVDVPADAEPGERNLSVIFAVPGNPDADGNISVTHRVAAKLYIEVPGLRTERIELGDLSGPGLVDAGPATFELPVHNRGNVHRRFEEDDQIVATTGHGQFFFDNVTVIGNGTRVVEAVWADPPLVCWCTVDVEIDDGEGNLLVASTRVITFPLRLTLGMTALVAGLVVVAIGRRRRRAARFERQLDAARREGVTAQTAPRSSVSLAAPTPGVPSPAIPPVSEPPAQASTSQPRGGRAATVTMDAPPHLRPELPHQPASTALFTAHGGATTSPRQRRRRRR